MRCEHCCRLLDEHVEGLLLPLDRASVETHLASCESCATEASRLASLVHALRDLPDAEVPDDFTQRVMGSLPEMLPAQEGAGHLTRWGLLAAAALLAFVGSLALLPEVGGPEVARDTLAPLSASLQLGGTVLSHSAFAMAGLLDAAASELVAAGPAPKLAFVLIFLASNLALAGALHRYRHAWLEEPARGSAPT